MKKLLCIFSTAAIITSAASTAYFGVNHNFNENQNQDETDISIQLSNYFEHASNNHSNIARNISNFDDTFVLNYIEFENNFLFVNFERLNENIATSSELISILKQDEFNNKLNDAFQLGLFEYTGSGVVYVPYEEKAISFNLNFDEIQNVNLSRNSAQRIEGRIFTRWFWFGTFQVELNNAATQDLVNILRNVALGVGIAAIVFKFLARILTGVGEVVARTIRLVLSILALYLNHISSRLERTNNGNGVVFRVTIVIVHSMRAL